MPEQEDSLRRTVADARARVYGDDPFVILVAGRGEDVVIDGVPVYGFAERIVDEDGQEVPAVFFNREQWLAAVDDLAPLLAEEALDDIDRELRL